MAPQAERLRAAAGAGFSTATDLADWLVRRLGLPFREAHHVTGALVKRAEEQGVDLAGLTSRRCGRCIRASYRRFTRFLGVDNSVASRASYGGTAPAQVLAQVRRWQEALG